MIRENFNRDWQFARGSASLMSAFMGGPQFEAVNLPHDAMVHEERTPDTANSAQTGFWPGGLYVQQEAGRAAGVAGENGASGV